MTTRCLNLEAALSSTVSLQNESAKSAEAMSAEIVHLIAQIADRSEKSRAASERFDATVLDIRRDSGQVLRDRDDEHAARERLLQEQLSCALSVVSVMEQNKSVVQSEHEAAAREASLKYDQLVRETESSQAMWETKQDEVSD